MVDDELDELLSELEDQDEPEPEPEPAIIQLPSSTNMIVEKVAETEIDIARELVAKFNEKFDLIGSREAEDRMKLKTVIGYLEGLVFNSNAPTVGYVEQLVSAYKVQADSNMNSTKSLDALSRIMSAGKGTTIMLNNVNNQSPHDEIIGLLDEDDL